MIHSPTTCSSSLNTKAPMLYANNLMACIKADIVGQCDEDIAAGWGNCHFYIDLFTVMNECICIG